MEHYQEFTINDIGTKCKSKREVYTVLSTEGGIFLPPIADATQSYLRAMLVGDKDYIKWSEVKVIKVPHLEGLRVKDILNWVRERVEIDRYIPDYDYQKEPNREWFINLVNTLLEDEFKVYVSDTLRVREQKVIKNKNLGVIVRNEFIEIFRNSKSISTSKGKTYFLARKPRARMEGVNEEDTEEAKEYGNEEISSLKRKIAELSAKIDDHQLMEEELNKNKNSLARLYDLGIIDSDGEHKE